MCGKIGDDNMVHDKKGTIMKWLTGSWISIFLVMLFVGSMANAANRYSVVAGGNWSSTATWSTTEGGAGGASVPTSADAVTIGLGASVTVDVANAACASVQLGDAAGGGSAGTLLFTSGSQLTVSGAVVLGNTGSTTAFGTITMTTGGTLICASLGSYSTTDVFTRGTGTVQLTATNTLPVSNTSGQLSSFNNLTINGGTTTLAGNTTIGGNLTVTSGTLDLSTFTANRSAAGGTLSVAAGATLSIGGTNAFPTNYTTNTLNPTSTVNYSGTAQSITNETYGNLTLSGSGVKTLPVALTSIAGNLTLNGTVTTTTVAGLTVTGNLSIGNGTTFNAAGFALTVTGATTVGSGTSGILNITSATGAKLFTGLVTVNAGGTWNNSGNSAVSFAGGITNNGTFTAGTGVYTFQTNAQALTGNFSIPSVTVTTITLTNNNTLTVGTALSGTGGLTQAAGATLNIGGTSGITTLTATNAGNTVNYTGAAQTVHSNNYANLTLSGSGTKTLTVGLALIGGNLTLSGTVTTTTVNGLTVTGNLSIGNGTTFNAAGFALTVAGTTTVGSGASGLLRITSAAGAKLFTGLVTINAGGTWNNSGNSAVEFQGGITNSGTFTAGTGVYTFDTNPQTLTGTLSIPSVTVTTITLTNNNTLTVGTTLSGTGGLTQAAGATLNIGGTSGITTLTATNAGNTVNYTGAAQTVHSNNYANLTLSGSGVKTLPVGLTSIAGNLTMSGTATTTTVAGLTVTGNLSIGNGTTFNAAGFALTVAGTTTVGGGTSGILNITSATGGKLFTGLVTINAGGTWNNSGNSAVEFRGGITNSGTFTAGTAVHIFDTNPQTLTGTLSIPSLTVTGVTVTNNGILTVGTALSGTGGLINSATGTLNLGGTFGITTLTTSAAGNTVNYSGASQTVLSQNYSNLGLTGSGTDILQTGTTSVANLTLSGTVTTTTVAGLTITGNLSIGNGTTLNAAGFALTVAGTTTVGGGTSGILNITSATGAKLFSGLVTVNAGGTWNNSGNSAVEFQGGITNGGTFTAGTGVHTFDTNAQSLAGTFSIPNVTVTTITLTNNNTLTVGTALSGTGGLTQAAGAALNIGGAAAITTLTATSAGNTVNYTGAVQTVNATNYFNLTLAGSGVKTMPAVGGTISGTLTTGGSATVNVAAAIGVGGNVVLGSGTTVDAGSFTHTVAGNWTNDGAAFTANSSTITFNGTSPQTIGGSAATTFNNITDANTSAILSVNTNCAITGTLAVNASAVLAVNAVLSPAAAAVISGTGTMTGNGTVQVTRTAATPDFSSQYTISNVTLANLTVEYDGIAAQTVSALTYGGLRINNAAGVTLGGNTTVNGILTFANGMITTGANTLSIGSAGSVSGAGAGQYVFGNLQRAFLTGVQSFTFDIGDASNYTPVALSFANITSGGTVTAKSTAGDHPQIATSPIAALYSVNRYWTLTSGGGLTFTSYGSTFTFVPGDVDAGANTSSFIAGNYNGSTWSSPTVGTRTSTSSQLTGLTGFGDFVLGNVSTLTITASSGANGTISPSGTVSVNYNSNQSFTITPSAYYHVDTLLVDGVKVDSSSGYTFTNVTTNHTIAVTFKITVYATSSHLFADSNPSVYGQTVTFSDSVIGGGPTPSGTVIFMDGSTVLDTASMNGSGVASFQTSALAVGVHTISGVYSGDANHNGSTSNVLSDTVNKAGTTTSVSPDVNPSVYGQTVNFTATVSVNSPGAGTPTGNVQFFDGATSLGTVALGGGANKPQAGLKSAIKAVTTPVVKGPKRSTVDVTASLGVSSLSAGIHSITAVYLDDANFTGGTSNVLMDTVNSSNTNVVVGADLNPSVYGQTVTLTATVTNSGTTPGGTVIFMDGSTVLDTASMNGSGVAIFQTSALGAGVHSISGIYGGDANHNGSTSNVLLDTVNKAGTTASVSADVNPSAYGQIVNFTATISVTSPGAGTPTGNVQFFDGATSLGTVTIGGGANKPQAGLKSAIKTVTTQVVKGVKRTTVDVTASLGVSSLSTGIHSITAVYLDDANFTGSTSNVLSDTVIKANVIVTLGVNPNPSVFGHPATFTATIAAVSPGAGTPTGSVIFKDGAVAIDTATLDGAGQAAFTTSSFIAGIHSITAAYNDDANFNSGVSSALSDTVTSSGTVVTLSSGTNPSVHGEMVTFTATVSNSGTTPTGTVIFKDGATALDTAVLNGAGVATFATSGLSVGVHPMLAEYSGDANHNGSSSAPLSDTVNKANTSVAVSSDINPSVAGETITLTATVSATAPGTGVPTGTVTFKNGTGVIGTGPLDGAGKATMTTSSLSTGVHSIIAEYNDDANFNSSASGSYSDTVHKANTSVSVVSGTNPSVSGQNVTFTATVTANSPGSGIATGTVTFKNGTGVIGTGTLDSTGKASMNISSLSTGVHSIVAEYNDDVNFNSSSSAAYSDTVDKANTTTALLANPNPSVFGHPVTFTATVAGVSPGAGVPTGQVIFKDGAVSVDTAVLDGSGQAVYATSALVAGVHPITASYVDDVNFNASASSVVYDTVSVSGTTVALSSSANPSVHGQSVTFTAMVSNSGTVPTGKLVLLDGATAIDTATLNGLGVATYSTSGLSTGIHPMTAVYEGDANHTGGSSSVLSDTVNKASTTVALTSTQNPSVSGQPVMFEATVSAGLPGSGVPTGTVTFKNGTGVIGTGSLDTAGKATLTISSLTTGVHSIVAEYNDDVNFSPSASSAYSDTVNKANTVVSFVSFTTLSVYGQTVGFTAMVSAVPPGVGIPTGTMTFKDGAAVLGILSLDSTGKASLSVSSLATGVHSIVAEYNDDASFNSGASLALSDTVLKSNTTTAVSSGTNPSAFGYPVTFTATVSAVSPGSGVPTGIVIFKDGANAIDTASLNGAGQATFVTSALTVGVHSITASYADDANFNPSVSTALSDTVNQLTILSVAGANGTITPSGAVAVSFGQNKSFTIQPDTGYFISDVRVDSVSVGTVNSYTFNNITANHLIQAFFAIKTYTITAMAGSHGTITPSGAVVVSYNASPTFQIQPDTGYFTADVVVDSVSVGALAAYQFHNVTANHTISATFAPINHPPSAALLITPANNDSVFGTSNPVTFIWHSSVDPDAGDSVRYTLHVWGSGFDTLQSGLKDSNQVLNLIARLHVDSMYHWSVSSTDGKVVVASPDTFTFRVVLMTGVADSRGRIPKEFALYQNYPNPFNPSTQVQFDIPERSAVTLTVYNILGEAVATLVDHETMEPGVKVVQLNAGNLASGMYIYRIAAEGAKGKNFINVKKMMLIK